MNVKVCVEYNRTIVEGPPGTGKTTYLLKQVEKLLNEGIDIERIGFFSFTTKAALEARTRAVKKFKLDPKKFVYFRTLHSLAHKIAISGPVTLFNEEQQKLFCDKYNLTWKDNDSSTRDITGSSIINLITLAKNRMISLEQQYNESNPNYPFSYLNKIFNLYNEYKKEEKLLDFSDIITKYNEVKDTPPLKALFIDEAQDLNKLQCEMTTLMEQTSEHSWYAGDDDQAVHKWCGANPYFFIKLKGNIIQLTQSYRVPKTIAELAKSLLPKIKTRRDKTWKARQEEGIVKRCMYFSNLKIADTPGTWYILTRNGYQLKDIKEFLRSEGIWFGSANKDRENVSSAVRKSVIEAIYTWVKLQKDMPITLEEVKTLYSYCKSLKKNSEEKDGIEWGFKNLSSFAPYKDDVEKTYKYKELVEKHGLKANIEYEWYEILQNLSDLDIEYIKACRRRGEKLMQSPRVTISTIHSIKGGEADHVALHSEINKIQYDSLMKGDDDEHRVFYVGITRAKKTLHIIESEKQWAYPI